jgi:hypothetical protein
VLNVVVTERDGEVQVRSTFLVPYTRETHTPKRWYGGTYDDVVVRTEARWRFASRICTGRWRWSIDEAPIPPGRETW